MNKEDVGVPSTGTGLVIGDYALGQITGRILTIIDSLYLPKEQSNAVKSLIRQAIYADEQNYIYIDRQLFDEIFNIYVKKIKKSPEGLPHEMVELNDFK